MNASFEEKSAWIQLLALVVVLGGYFLMAGWLLAGGVREMGAFVGLFVAAVIFMVVVIVVGHIVAAVTGRADERDERDRLIGWRAESNASWILGAGVFCAMTGLVVAIDRVWIVHLLLLSMLLSEVAKLGLQLRYYRRGM